MFEITPQDIAQLDDKQLRTLIGLLCEAELRSHSYSTVGVTWGGDQNAPDGGLDVHVSVADERFESGFIPRRQTGFQVKKQDMRPHAISAEMRPNGELRPIICDLAARGGAYIIVSSRGSTADSALATRRKTMEEATGKLTGLAVDFYDRTRLATWVRSHAGLVVWVRQEIGRAIPGWEPFGAWAYPAGGTEAEYLLEEGVRIRERTARAHHDLAADEGLKKIRGILSEEKSVVRLVGLSGVGKTRFVQALFDNRIGEEALDPAVVIYTNMNNEPNPQPMSLVSDLIANGSRAILVIDNCQSDLHTRLAQLVKGAKSLLSVLTVEYDIHDDQPESTEVFEIQAGSVELIEALLKKRFPKLSQVDARTIANFSGGNARVAIALADTVGRGGALGSLDDTQLFERLFLQRKGQDRSLLEMAQACALVYSFDGEDVSDGGGAELARISRLVGCTADQAHRDVAELLRRDLAQRRGKWRAVLPHALANRLAAAALQNIPFARVQECLINGAPERLTISLSRRLGYLDISPEAVAIVQTWFDPKGWIGEHVWNLNEFGKSIFRNALPAAAEAGLRAIEISLPAYDEDTLINTGEYIPRALRLLAWDASLFERCARLLQVLAIYGGEAIAKEASEIHRSLFHLYLSGTRATAEQRAAVIKALLSSGDKERGLGLAALEAMLESDHFSSSYDFEFGAHSRDYGYQPGTYGDLRHWYGTAFVLIKAFAFECLSASATRTILAANFRGLWMRTGLRDELEATAVEISAQGFWRDGWLAVKQTRFYDEKDRDSENYARLSKLEELLRPCGLIEIVRGRVFTSEWYDVDDVDANDGASFQRAMEQQQAQAKALGREVARDASALRELMTEIVSSTGHLWHFGMGLAQGAQDPDQLWEHLVDRFAATPTGKRDTRALSGFLMELGSRTAALAEPFLDHALEHEPLAPYFPILQASVPITERGMARLTRSIELGKVPIEIYSNIHLGRAIEVVSAKDIAAYILKLADLPDGEQIAIHVMNSQFFDDRQCKRPHAKEIVEVGRVMLRRFRFDRRSQRQGYHLCQFAQVCVAGEGGYDVAKAVCEHLRAAIAGYSASRFGHDWLLRGLLKIQPKAVLDVLLTGDKDEVALGADIIQRSDGGHSNSMPGLSEQVLFEWCDGDPGRRFPSAALIVPLFTSSAGQNSASWTPLAFRLVHNAPDPVEVMRSFVGRFRPTMWSGSRSTILETNAKLLDTFDVQGNEALAAFISTEKKILQQEARECLAWETKTDKDRDERFE